MTSLTQAMVHAPVPPRAEVAAVDTRVMSNASVTDGYRLLVLKAPPAVLGCVPGQFFHLRCPVTETEHPYLRRPMSIYGYNAARGDLRFLYKVAGTGTRALAGLKPGSTLNVLGPLGRGFTVRDEWRNLCLVARGVGLATLAPLAQEAMRTGRRLTAICSARSPELLMSVELFERMGAKVITVTDAERTSGMDNLRALIEAQIQGSGIDALYTCGSSRILRLLQDIGQEHGIPGEIALEQQMACGIGMCQCCVRDFRRNGQLVQERVCREGPVFDLQDAVSC